MRALAVWLNRLLWTGLVTVVLVVGAVVALGRHYEPYLARHQDDIVAWLSRRTGLRLEVDSVRAEWRPFAPHVAIEGLRLRHPQRDETVAAIDFLEFRVGLLQTLRRGVPVFTGVRGSGLRAVLQEAPLGKWQLRGFGSERAAGGGNLLDILLALRQATFEDSRLSLRFYHGGSAELSVAALRLERAGEFRRLQLSMTVADDGAPVELTAEARGDPRDRERFSALAHAEFTHVDLSSMLPMARGFGIDMRHGRLDGRAWLTWEPGRVVTVRGEIAVPELDLAALIGRDTDPVTDLRARFVMHEREGERQVWLHDVGGRWGSQALRVERLWLGQRGAQPDRFFVAVPALDVAEVAGQLAGGKLLPPRWRAMLDSMAPRGALENVFVTVPTAPRHRAAFSVRAFVRELAVQPWRNAPGVRGAEGFVVAGLDGGRAWLNTGGLSLELPSLYDAPLALSRVRGRIDWQRRGDRMSVASSALQAELASEAVAVIGTGAQASTALAAARPGAAASATVAASLALDLPLVAEAPIPPAMTLAIGARGATAAQAAAFVPTTVSGPLRDWLDTAVVGGDLPQVGFLYHGSLRKGDEAGRTLQLYLAARNGTLAYQPAWPPLQRLTGELWLDERALRAEVAHATLYDSLEVGPSSVLVAPQPEDGSLLRVDGAVAGAGDAWLRLLRETPIAAQTGPVASALHWDGPAAATLALTLPLGGAKSAMTAVVEGALQGGTLSLARPEVSVTDVSGSFSYRRGGSESAGAPAGLTVPALTGRLFGRPLALTITTDATGAVTGRARAHLAMVDWQHHLPAAVSERVHGTAPLNARLRWLDGRAEVHASSTLSGLTIGLPPPYDKPAEVILPLRLDGEIRFGDTAPRSAAELNARAAVAATVPTRTSTNAFQGQLSAVLGDWFTLASAWSGGQLEGGVLQFGSRPNAPAVGEPAGVFRITGSLPPIELGPWREVARSVGDEGPSRAGPAIVIENLFTPELAVVGRKFQAVRLDGQRQARGWSLAFASDLATGRAELPSAAAGVPEVHLSTLRLPGGTVAAEPAATAETRSFDPRAVLPFDLQVDRLWLENEELGAVGFQLRPVTDGLALRNLSGELRGIQLAPTGERRPTLVWTRTAQGDTTRFSGRLAVRKLADVLERWGYERAVGARQGHLDAVASWSGAPTAFSIDAVRGEAQLLLEDGRFLKASGSAEGALKLVGIFNLANLVRRLRLDFTDLFSDGIAFDEIEGSFAMADGRLRTLRPLTLEGPASAFRLAGSLDFVSDTVDMEVVVRLPLASNLPWVAALAGGLPAAAGVYVASKLFGDKVDRYSSAVYQISGDWRDPDMRFRRIFDEEQEEQGQKQGQEERGSG